MYSCIPSYSNSVPVEELLREPAGGVRRKMWVLDGLHWCTVFVGEHECGFAGSENVGMEKRSGCVMKNADIHPVEVENDGVNVLVCRKNAGACWRSSVWLLGNAGGVGDRCVALGGRCSILEIS